MPRWLHGRRGTIHEADEVAEPEGDGHQHPAGEVIAIDEWAERVRVRRLGRPESVDLVAADSFLHERDDGDGDAQANDRTHERLDPPVDRGGHRQQQHAERDNEREPHTRPSRDDRERLETKPSRRLACRVDEAVRPGRELKVVPSEHFCGDRTDPGNELDRQRRELEQDRAGQHSQSRDDRSWNPRPRAAIHRNDDSGGGASRQKRPVAPGIDGPEGEDTPGDDCGHDRVRRRLLTSDS